ncbi:hypothetical protein GCM10023188_26100 [Pontibacter saemangeumensis]|uniref:Lipoprotein n=1 Tax=Pontibacter saemangeumensis TaxID=1084525 RepID=A0ABP8LTZ5_9BACT
MGTALYFAILFALAVLLGGCATTPPALKGGHVKAKKHTLYYQSFLTEGMAGKKDKSSYRYKKKPLTSLIGR